MTQKDSSQNDDDAALFHAAMRDVAPLPAANKAAVGNSPVAPVPRRRKQQEQFVAEDRLSDHIAIEMEAGDDWSYVRPGMPHQTLRKLRRGHWAIQANLDLHGLTRDEARRELSVFLDACTQRGLRCVRVIHGKGLSSKNREPVLKTRIGNWLLQRADVLAFCQARAEDGGGGAILILLKTKA
ncbi:MAG: Smr/MutS family protein [Gammaproteobacteria bacterium]|nr:MAG: Smr/MutS family protein [Gammaproteobacteria bacterium]